MPDSTRAATSNVTPRAAGPVPAHHPPAFALPLLALLVIAGIAAAFAWARRGALRAWRRYAATTHSEFRARDRFSPGCLTGVLRGRPFLMETATSHEDDAPYYHTRGAVPVRNNAGFILGLRRKSLLEEMQTRSERAPFDLTDPDFEKRFFVVCNDGASLPEILTQEVRRELARYPDIEVYVRLEQIEWRRAGEESDVRAIARLNEMLVELADTIDGLPRRPRTLSQRLADEALIAKGV
jgi:hypothetical protein